MPFLDRMPKPTKPQHTRKKRKWLTIIKFAFALVVVVFIAAVVVAIATGGSDKKSGSSASSSAPSEPGTEQCSSAAPSFYRQDYNGSLADPLAASLYAYRAAVAGSATADEIRTAGILYSQIKFNIMMVKTATYGCYNPVVVQSIDTDGNAVAAKLDDLNSATPTSDIAPLVGAIAPLLRTYVDDQNTYAAQFGAEQTPNP